MKIQARGRVEFSRVHKQDDQFGLLREVTMETFTCA